MATAPSPTVPNLATVILDGAPGDVVLVGPRRQWTRGELVRAVEQRAAGLAEKGVGAGTVHPIDGIADISTVVTLLAVWRRGAVAGILNPALTSPEWAQAVETLTTAADVPPGTAAILWT